LPPRRLPAVGVREAPARPRAAPACAARRAPRAPRRAEAPGPPSPRARCASRAARPKLKGEMRAPVPVSAPPRRGRASPLLWSFPVGQAPAVRPSREEPAAPRASVRSRGEEAARPAATGPDAPPEPSSRAEARPGRAWPVPTRAGAARAPASPRRGRRPPTGRGSRRARR
jgi:ribonuclease E